VVTSRSPLAVLLLAAVLLALPLPQLLPAADAATDACVQPVPLAEVAPGQTGRGLTVVRGTQPEAFGVTVIDVLRDGLAPGVPLIVVEVHHPEVDRVGGVWAGMSGSPVYLGDRLLGAVSYGFTWGASPIVGVTPAEAMLALPRRGAVEAAMAEAAGEGQLAVAPSPRVLAAAGPGAAGTFTPLRVPLLVSGPTGAKLTRFAELLQDRFPGALVVPGAGPAAAAAPAPPLVPGANLAASLMYGDYTAAALGTATTVCDGVVTAFGHPLFWEGATSFGLHGATTVRVMDDPLSGPFELANLGPPIGRLDQDRGAGVAGRLGQPPTPLTITSSITNRDEGRTVTGRTDAYYPDPMWALSGHLYSNYDTKALDDLYFAGTSTVDWRITGTRADGSSFNLRRQNRHADRWDLSSASIWELASTAQQLQDNPYEEIRLRSVHYEGEAASPYRVLHLVADQVTASVGAGPQQPVAAGITVGPGQAIRLRVPVRAYRGDVRVVPVTLLVPADASGMGELAIGAEMAPDPWECLYDPQACGQGGARSFDDLLALFATRPRADDLAVILRLYPAEGMPGPLEVREIRTTVRLDDVLQGLLTLPATVTQDATEGCPVDATPTFADVPLGSTHAGSVDCAAALGLTTGVSLDPPRFAPARAVRRERAVRRDQAASFVARLVAAGTRPLPTSGTRFEDLDGNVHREAIEQLAAAGIVRGGTDGRFDPARSVTREQLATMLVGALRWSTGTPMVATAGPHFADVGATHGPAVDAAFELGLVKGRSDGSFGPGIATRRDQLASVLVRAMAALACAAPG
jgi:hypothetical protein